MNTATETGRRFIGTFHVYDADAAVPPVGIPAEDWPEILSAAGVGKATGSTGARTTTQSGARYQITFRTQVSDDQWQIRSTTPTADVYVEAPELTAEQTLRATSDDALIDALLRLTHQISGEGAARREAKSRGWIPDAARHLNAENDLRAKRELLRAEILRRMGGTR